MKSSPLFTKISEYQTWRGSLTKTISDYRDWLANSTQADGVKELRLYDILEGLERDQIVIAFLAEYSRGKSETINALFFSDFNQRMLPSEAGRRSMCSTEILWDSSDEPSIKLLPIASRKSEDSLTYLKTTPNAWHKFRLNIHSADEMKTSLRKLIEEVEVTQQEAEALGLWDPENTDMVNSIKTHGLVKIPAWRHAIINYPHPLLKNGLVIIDTPGLNTLGAEPELTLNIIPSAHAVVFLTATDSGISKADLNIWNEYVKGRTKHKFVLLNKIDILWDDQKPKQDVINEIDRRVNITAHQLGVSPEIVFPVSSQKALIAKIKKNSELLEESRILELEAALGNQIIQAKHEILGRTVAAECSEMIKGTRKIVQQRLLSLRGQVKELKDLRGKNFEESKHILGKVVTERKRYEASIPTFNLANEKITAHGKKLLKHLSVAYLDESIAESRKAMGDSWTTVGLNQNMRNVMKQATELADYVTKESKAIKKLADNIYDVFQSKHGFEIFESPELDMSNFLNNMRALEKITDDFCRDPINVLTEKHFLIRKFFLGLGTQKQKIFEQARKECEHWLLDVLSTLKIQMTEHKATLNDRTKNLMSAKASAESLDNQLAVVEREYALLSKDAQAIDGMLLYLIIATKPAIKAKLADKNNFGLDKTLQMPELPFLNVPTIQPPPHAPA